MCSTSNINGGDTNNNRNKKMMLTEKLPSLDFKLMTADWRCVVQSSLAPDFWQQTPRLTLFLQSDNTFNYFCLRCLRYFQVVWYVSGLRMIVHSFSKQFGVLWYLATDSASLTLFCPPDKPIKYSKTRLRNGRKRHSHPQVRNLINRVLESNHWGGSERRIFLKLS